MVRVVGRVVMGTAWIPQLLITGSGGSEFSLRDLCLGPGHLVTTGHSVVNVCGPT